MQSVNLSKLATVFILMLSIVYRGIGFATVWLALPETGNSDTMELFLSGCYLGEGEYLILVSANSVSEPAAEYKKRGGTETLFGALKSRGFNLEDTHLKEPERLSRLLALLAIAFTWAFVVGQWQAAVKELKLKKHG